jgi:hypothetical protein
MTEKYDARVVRNLVILAAIIGTLLGATAALLYALAGSSEPGTRVVQLPRTFDPVHLRQPEPVHIQRLPRPEAPVVIVTQPEATPPFKAYRSGRDGNTGFEVVGSVTSDDLLTRAALYGRPSPAYSGRWQYFVRTAGDDVSMDVTSVGRECLENMGCEELYGGELVSVPELSKSPMKVRIHRTAPM